MNTALRDNIDWVGYVDWTVRDFHGYDTERGSTYNAYLIRDENTTLIDTVKEPYVEHLIYNMRALVDLSEIKFIVCNHAEPDHAGGLTKTMQVCPNATLVCNKKCKSALAGYHDISDWKIRIVSTGDSLSLGKRTLRFIETPMLHWPESMFTHVSEEKLLFSMDAFGQHYASSNRFDDEVALDGILTEAKTYYANIVMPYGKRVIAALKDLAGIEVEMIAPSHGLIWRSSVSEIVEAYSNWAVSRPASKVLVIYDTMWESTAGMARAILNGASQQGVETGLIYIRGSNLTRIATEVLDAAAVAFGSSTLNGGMLPMAGAVLTYLKSLRPVGKAGIAFGSYGWGRGGPEAIDEWLRSMKFDMLRDPLKSKFRPDDSVLRECSAAGKMLAEKAIELSA